MRLPSKSAVIFLQSVLLAAPLLLIPSLQARNDVLGRIDFVAANKAARDSGVWVDGQYVGYLKELKGSKKVLLLPGEHEISVRQTGYRDFNQELEIGPGQVHELSVDMEKDPAAQYPAITSEVKISAHPERAAVFVDGKFVGHAEDFGGIGHGMLLSPGKHHIKIFLPGYQPFETEVNLQPNQKLKLKTDLIPGATPAT